MTLSDCPDTVHLEDPPENNNFRRDSVGKFGRTVSRSYGIESHENSAHNAAFLRTEGPADEIPGFCAPGEDGLEATSIAVAIHESMRTGNVVHLR